MRVINISMCLPKDGGSNEFSFTDFYNFRNKGFNETFNVNGFKVGVKYYNVGRYEIKVSRDSKWYRVVHNEISLLLPSFKLVIKIVPLYEIQSIEGVSEYNLEVDTKWFGLTFDGIPLQSSSTVCRGGIICSVDKLSMISASSDNCNIWEINEYYPDETLILKSTDKQFNIMLLP